MQYADALRRLDQRTNYEATGGSLQPSLERMSALTDLLANPQKSYPAIHVTGTNGKGTTVATASGLLRGLALSVGTYTSPHLHSPRERMAYDGAPISEEEFAETFEYLEPILDEVDKAVGRVTWFEAVTAMAQVWFAERAVEVVVAEVGMGGTWDATNLMDGRVAVITKVALDHRELGDTTVEIAREKVGIVKHGAICITGEQDPEVLQVIRDHCRHTGATLRRLGVEFSIEDRTGAVGGQVLDLVVDGYRMSELFVPLYGEALATDVAIGVAAVSAFIGDREMGSKVLRAALSEVHDPGRVEIVRRHPLVIVDGAHNADASAALAATLVGSFHWKRLHLVLGMLGDHFTPDVPPPLLGLADTVIATQPASPRAMTAEALAAEVAALGANARVVPDVEDAVAVAIDRSDPDDAVLVTGSLYTVAQARAYLLGLS
jgi:dihydrofolate synthase / folylpolyglutamate synthase